MANRYTVKQGKFGSYFYDKEGEADLTLNDVKCRLNNYESRVLELISAKSDLEMTQIQLEHCQSQHQSSDQLRDKARALTLQSLKTVRTEARLAYELLAKTRIGAYNLRKRIARFEKAFKISEQTHDQMRQTLKTSRAETQRVSEVRVDAQAKVLHLRGQLRTINVQHANQSDIIKAQDVVIRGLRERLAALDPRPNDGPLEQPALGTVTSILDTIRGLGWAVAVHNDYTRSTYWLFTKTGHAVKGEGKTDLEALAIAQTRIRACERRWK